MVITFNYKEGTDTITFDDLKASAAAEKSGSDLDCLTAPDPYDPNLFPIGNGSGSLVFFSRYESTYFRNGVQRKPASKPRGPRKKKQVP